MGLLGMTGVSVSLLELEGEGSMVGSVRMKSSPSTARYVLVPIEGGEKEEGGAKEGLEGS